MPTPFPGMDPYLERPDLWPDVPNSLITALRNDLAPKLRPDYYLAIEERLYLAEAEPVMTRFGWTGCCASLDYVKVW
ncbi:MAG TPA: DUF4058 family protein [Anaerolineae bacterium]|jgi:hypothetical protein